ncbi:BrnA antitoxin family protein [Acinetobacter sp. B5B]|uniref:BrnA antitoxin family protein n=1 Tax=Acinetobacter baretiae TaxID=2605383 RepID=UPI0018C1E0B0|nr:BrnA antitoxin family protein [Acinetobacter baretiae]MBF7684091.1 BrnA antitoxin family protein [Acinetobacter baretiae]
MKVIDREKIPSFNNIEDAENFVENSDLSKFDLSGFKPMNFEFEPKSKTLNMRVPESLLDALKEKAKEKGIPYTRYVRLVLEQSV